ncbi:MAG TPA: T9SS type A sorting domain-containing protein, partial [candidate division Zixibacteria bacterium]|nr:T9SS type A sorting domain-containing protein [candidate division Zixibacteria bacterium]
EPTSLCFGVETSGTGFQVTVNPAGTFTAGVVCIDVDTAGTYDVEIIASNDCGADTSYTSVQVKANFAPILNLPATQTFMWCPDDTGTIQIDGIFAQDAIQITSLEMACGVGEFNRIFSDTGVVTFVPDTAGMYMFCFEASDGCQTVTDTFYVDIQEKEDCDVCVRLSIIGGDPVPVGVQHEVLLNVETNTIIGGFDILVSFDASVMTFNTATIVGTEIDGWEYFTYRLGSEDCGANCPSGLVRMVGIADLSNGPYHPSSETLEPNGAMISMDFLVANDQNLGDLFLPIEFAWYDCGDNTFSNTLGSILYLDSRIYNAENFLLWDENDEVLFPESSRPFGLGANDQCMVGASSAPIRCIEFINGGIKVIHPDSIDARGDINLNNVPYEIGDAVLYSNYFIYGLGVFNINVAGQVAASDVNADGLTLSVADLVLMIRIIVGDADPIPKLVPHSEELILNNTRTSSEISVTSNSSSEIGGLLLVYDLDEDIVINEVKPSEEAAKMQMAYDVIDNQLRILMYDMGRNSIAAGENSIVDISFDGSGKISLSKSEFVDYQGQPYKVLSKLNQLPEGFSLSQNYPNPFNPTTTIELALPQATDWTLSVYNINGNLVRKFTGNNDAGIVAIEWDGSNQAGTQVASGMYLYRIEAADFSETKKMILLK